MCLLITKSQGHWNLCGQNALPLGSKGLEVNRGSRTDVSASRASVENMGQSQEVANRHQRNGHMIYRKRDGGVCLKSEAGDRE